MAILNREYRIAWSMMMKMWTIQYTHRFTHSWHGIGNYHGRLIDAMKAKDQLTRQKEY
jgi:hypothetical protein